MLYIQKIQNKFLKKVHRVIKFNQNSWLKPYIDIDSDLRKNEEKTLKNTFFKVDE